MDTIWTPADVERQAAEAGISLKELCARAEISHTTFYRWRSGATSPSIDVYTRIIKALRAVQADVA